MIRLWYFFANLFSRRFKYKEGKHYDLIPNVERAKADDPYPWDIRFLDRLVKVNHVGLNGIKMDINVEYLEGSEFNSKESVKFGDLITQLITESKMVKEK